MFGPGFPGHLARSAVAGAAFGCAGLAVGLIRYALEGGPSVGPLAITLLQASIYVAAFAAAGVVVGLLFPLRHTRSGAAVVGAAAAIIVFAGIAVMVDGTDWTSATWTGVIILGVVMGSFFGAMSLWTPRLLSADETLPPVRLRTLAPRASNSTRAEEQQHT